MIWCRFASADGPRFGLVHGDKLQPVSGVPFGAHEEEGSVVAVADVRLLPPVIPGTLFAVGMNYRGHIERALEHGAVVAFPSRPEVGYRANSALIGPGEAIVRPSDFEHPLEVEGELVAVIGRTVRHADREEAVASVAGWTIGNDVSARQWQKGDRTLWRSKNCDTFKPMGPFVVTDIDPLEATTTVTVNGQVKAQFPTGDMIFDPYDYICEISRYITLSPGDVLWMGTDTTAELVPGDTVEVSISGIGTLSNPVVDEELR